MKTAGLPNRLIRFILKNEVNNKMNFKRIFTMLLSLTFILLFLCGCNPKQAVIKTISNLNPVKTETVDPGIDEVGFTIPYLRSDSLNPYKATQTINQNISTLLFDSLFSLGNDFKTSNLVADSFTSDSTKLTVTIKSGLTFTDGSALSPDDVVYSFNLAKKSDNYSAYLGNVSSAKASSSDVIFTLKAENPYEVNNLTFPIIKSGSDKDTKSSDDYSANIPTGSGRYSVTTLNNDKVLAVNKDRLGGYHPKYNYVGLKDVTEVSSIPILFSLGEIDFYTDNFSEGKYTRYTGTSSDIELTNFVYMGINSNTKVLSDSKVRRAIALAINRSDLASISFSSFAQATSSPFHPSFYALSDCTLPPIKFDLNAGIDLLTNAGFDKVTGAGLRYSDVGKLQLKLVVNKDNSFKLSMARSIQQSLSKAGITITIDSLSYSDYLKAIKSEAYDLYLGETKLSNSFDLSAFFTKNGGLDYGIDTTCPSAKAYAQLESGKIQMQGFLDAFADDLPIIPIAYREGVTVKSTKIKTAVNTVAGDCFNNIDEWTTK